MFTKLALVSFHNGGNFLYRFDSKKPIKDRAFNKIIKYFEDTEGWNEERDHIELFDDEINGINLDKL